MNQLTATQNRVQSIDILRGIVMIIMALDHVRDFFHDKAMIDDPLNLATTTPWLYFTRWITHFCAPTFVFLAGTSAYLMGRRKTKKELSLFLIKRGIWLVLVEIFIVTLGLSFNPLYNVIFLQVIWAIGVSMIILGLLVWAPYTVILLYGLLVVFGHNLLDYAEAERNGQLGFLWSLLHGSFSFQPIGHNRFIAVIYAFPAWSGVMALGYCFGKLFSTDVSSAVRQKRLMTLGFIIIILFVALRSINHYGNPLPWTPQRSSTYTLLSFLNTNKYPPSLMYLCMTLGPAILFLGLIENMKGRLSRFFMIYGKVPFFYYVIHFYLIHILCVIAFFASGYGKADIISQQVPFLFRPPQFGFNLWGVYGVWLFVVLSLYPLCRWYNRYKATHNQWWLSYL